MITARLVGTFVLLGLLVPDLGAATAIRSWRDARGGIHFSNVEGRWPSGAVEVALEPVALDGDAASAPMKRAAARAITGRGPTVASSCPEPDVRPLARVVDTAVSRELPTEELALTLIVAGSAVRVPEGGVSFALAGDGSPNAAASLDQGALAYPAGSPCPGTPPLERYPVTAPGTDSGLCGDFRRALAQVGIAGNRNQNVARSFRSIARRFVEVAEADNVANDAFMSVTLPAWTVDAHIAQTDLLAQETDAFVDELQVALEEIDGAARARGCW